MENNTNLEIGTQIRNVYLSQLPGKFIGAKYSKLVQHHLRTLGPNLESALSTAVEVLTEEERTVAESLIDEYNQRGFQQGFWQCECADTVKAVCNKFAEEMSQAGLTTDEKIMFNIFQIITLNFALQTRDQRGLREFAGIRKNWLFR